MCAFEVDCASLNSILRGVAFSTASNVPHKNMRIIFLLQISLLFSRRPLTSSCDLFFFFVHKLNHAWCTRLITRLSLIRNVKKYQRPHKKGNVSWNELNERESFEKEMQVGILFVARKTWLRGPSLVSVWDRGSKLKSQIHFYWVSGALITWSEC